MSGKLFFKWRRAISSLILIFLLTNSPALAKPCFDFFGSGRSSFALFYRQTGGFIGWKLRNNGGAGAEDALFGVSQVDYVTPGYFDNDNKADIGVWRIGFTFNPTAFYYFRPSTSQSPTAITGIQWGRSDPKSSNTNDEPGFEADYDGDGIDEPTIVRRVSGVWNWFYLRSSNQTLGAVQFGNASGVFLVEDIPIGGADYAGDNRAELTVLRLNSVGDAIYLIGDSNSGELVKAQHWGNYQAQRFILGDFIGDAKADFAAWRFKDGVWSIKENGGAERQIFQQWGLPLIPGTPVDFPVCGDYNGDGKSDIAIYRNLDHTFYWLNSPGNTTYDYHQVIGGNEEDVPVGFLRTF